MQLSTGHGLWNLSIQGRISSARDDPNLSEPRILIDTHRVVLREIGVIRAEFLLIGGSNLGDRSNMCCIVNGTADGRSRGRLGKRQFGSICKRLSGGSRGGFVEFWEDVSKVGNGGDEYSLAMVRRYVKYVGWSILGYSPGTKMDLDVGGGN